MVRGSKKRIFLLSIFTAVSLIVLGISFKGSGFGTTIKKTRIPTVFPTTLSPTPTVTPTKQPAPTQQPSVAPSPTPTPTPQPTLLPQTDYETHFDTYSSQYAVSKELLKKIALCESHTNPVATNGDYTGMFQFSTATWIATRQEMGKDSNPDLRMNAQEAIETAAYKISRGGQNAWRNCL